MSKIEYELAGYGFVDELNYKLLLEKLKSICILPPSRLHTHEIINAVTNDISQEIRFIRDLTQNSTDWKIEWLGQYSQASMGQKNQYITAGEVLVRTYSSLSVNLCPTLLLSPLSYSQEYEYSREGIEFILSRDYFCSITEIKRSKTSLNEYVDLIKLNSFEEFPNNRYLFILKKITTGEKLSSSADELLSLFDLLFPYVVRHKVPLQQWKNELKQAKT